MKIIDLINKIANDEDVPKRIKYDNKIWVYDIYEKDYNYNGMEYAFYGLFANYFDTRLIDSLNDEVEILEEEKKILEEKKIPEKINEDIDYIDCSIKLFPATSSTKFNYKEKVIINKINEIIDYLKSKSRK